MNDSFQLDTKETSHAFDMPALTLTLKDMDDCPAGEAAGTEFKNIFNKIVEDKLVKEAIYEDFSEIIQNVFLGYEKDHLIIEYCKKYPHLQYPRINSVLSLETKLGCPSFCLVIDGKKKNVFNVQETLRIIHRICEEQAQEQKRYAERISDRIKDLNTEYKKVLEEYEDKKPDFERKEQEFQEEKAKYHANYPSEDKEEAINILDEDNNLLSLDERSKHTDLSASNTQDQCSKQIKTHDQKDEYAKQEFEDLEVKLASLQNNISILEELYALAQAGKIDKSFTITINAFQSNKNMQQKQNSTKQISIDKFLKDYNINSYHSYLHPEQTLQNILGEQEDSESDRSISLTDISEREEEQIEDLQNEIAKLKKKLTKREATISEHDKLFEIIKNERSDVNEIKEYLEEIEVNINYKRQKDGNTVLHYAVKYLDIFKFLFKPLSRQKKLEYILDKNIRGETVFHMAAMGNDREICEFLLSFLPGNEINKCILEQDYLGQNTFQKSIQFGSLDVCKYLFSLLPDDGRIEWIQTALNLAIECNNEEKFHYFLEELIEKGGRQLVIQQMNKRNETLLHKVAALTNTTSYKLIISELSEESKIAYIFREDDTMNTALHQAVRNGNFEMCQYLVNSLPKVKKVEYVLKLNAVAETPISYAFSDKTQKMFCFLLDQLPLQKRKEVIIQRKLGMKSFLHSVSCFIGTTALEYMTSSFSEEERIKYLFEKCDRSTLLYKAVILDNLEMCKYLVNLLPGTKKIEYIFQENDGQSALTLAFKHRLAHLHHLSEEIGNERTRKCYIPVLMEKNHNQNKFYHITASCKFEKSPELLDSFMEKIQEDIVLAICTTDDCNESLFYFLFNNLPVEDKKKFIVEINMRNAIALHSALSSINERIHNCLTELIQKNLTIIQKDDIKHIEILSIQEEYKKYLISLEQHNRKVKSPGTYQQRNKFCKVIFSGNLDICKYFLGFLPEPQREQFILIANKDEECQTKSENLLINTTTTGQNVVPDSVEERKDSDSLQNNSNNQNDPSEIDMASICDETTTDHYFGLGLIEKLKKERQILEARLQKLPMTNDSYFTLLEMASGYANNRLRNLLKTYDVCPFREEFGIRRTALQVLLSSKGIESSKILLKSISKGKRTGYILERDKDGNNTLYHTTEDVNKCKLLIDALPKNKRTEFILQKNNRGETALHVGPKSMKFLIKSLPQDKRVEFILHKNNQGETASHVASKHSKTLKFLIKSLPEKNRAEFILERDKSGNTLLHEILSSFSIYMSESEREYKLDACKFILGHLVEKDKECYILAKNAAGKTVLHQAIRHLFFKPLIHQFIGLLSEERKKELLFERDNVGHTALHYAVIECHYDFIVKCDFLIQLLAEEERAGFLDIQDNDGCTALHLAAAALKSDICAFLIQMGANKTIASKKNETPLDVVKKCQPSNEHDSMLKELTLSSLGVFITKSDDALKSVPVEASHL